MPIDHLILTAVTSEAAPFLQQYPEHTTTKTAQGLIIHQFAIGSKQIALCVAGVGTSFTALTIGSCIAALEPDTLWFSGTCGGIDPSLSIGSIVIGTLAFEIEIQHLYDAIANSAFAEGLELPCKGQRPPLIYSADSALITLAEKTLADDKDIYYGTLATSNLFPAPVSLFADLKKQKVLAIDMESSALYQAGWLYNKPVLAVRCVSNQLDDKGNDPDIAQAQPVAAAEKAASTVMRTIAAS